MSQATQTKEAVYQIYKKHDRDVYSIIHLAAELKGRSDITELFNGIAYERYSALLDFADLNKSIAINMDALVDKLLQYHQKIMHQRGQIAWVEKIKKALIAVILSNERWLNESINLGITDIILISLNI